MKYIKVSEEGKPSIVILAANKAYYLSKGAKITEPTQEEIAEFFPEEKKKESENIVENEALKARITELETENEALKAENEMLRTRIVELETEKPKTNKGKEDK